MPSLTPADPTLARTFNDVIEAGEGNDAVLGQFGNDIDRGRGGRRLSERR